VTFETNNKYLIQNEKNTIRIHTTLNGSCLNLKEWTKKQHTT